MTKRAIPSRRDLLATGAGALATSSILPRPAFSQGTPVKVGVILYLCGVQAFMGQQTRKGNEFGAKIVKEAGGPPMEFIYGDAESKPENGRIVAERLIREGCQLLIGTNDSGSTISVAQAAEAAKIPFLINIASAPQITEQGFTQIFRNFPPAAPGSSRNAVVAHQGTRRRDRRRAKDRGHPACQRHLRSGHHEGRRRALGKAAGADQDRRPHRLRRARARSVGRSRQGQGRPAPTC